MKIVPYKFAALTHAKQRSFGVGDRARRNVAMHSNSSNPGIIRRFAVFAQRQGVRPEHAYGISHAVLTASRMLPSSGKET